MKLKDAQKFVMDLILPPLKDRGFKKKGLSFRKHIHQDCYELIDFGFYKDKLGRIRFGFGVGICFPKINSFLNLEEKEEATIGVPIHFLHEDRQYTDWLLDDETGDDLLSDILQEIDRFAMPFFEKYSQLSEVRDALGSENPKRWFTLTPEQRVMTLAAIDCVEGNKSKALLRLDEALASMKDAPYKKTNPIKELRERIVKAS